MRVWLLISIFARNRERKQRGGNIPSLGNELLKAEIFLPPFSLFHLVISRKENYVFLSAVVEKNYLGNTRVPSLNVS